MYKLSIINNLNGKEFGATFETQEEANTWRDSCIANESWGLNAYSEKLTSEATPKPGYITSKSCVIQEAFGEEEEVTGVEYSYETEYTVTEEDLSLDAEWVTSQSVAKRQEEYSKIDSLLKEALVEKELGDSTKWDEYLVLREAIKTENPL
jgi:hypothetical protein